MNPVLLNAPYIDQTRDWPTGCESVSAVMLLQYLGYDISVEQFVQKHLVCGEFFRRQGQLFGPDPACVFAGSPRDPDSMGCYPPVIVNALNSVFAGQGYAAADATGAPMETLLQSVASGLPVVFWASIDLLPTVPGPSWRLADSGKEFCWISNEHCMLLLGCDDKNYWFNDPWHNHGTVAYPRALVEQRHAEQRQMAVTVRRIPK